MRVWRRPGRARTGKTGHDHTYAYGQLMPVLWWPDGRRASLTPAVAVVVRMCDGWSPNADACASSSRAPEPLAAVDRYVSGNGVIQLVGVPSRACPKSCQSRKTRRAHALRGILVELLWAGRRVGKSSPLGSPPNCSAFTPCKTETSCVFNSQGLARPQTLDLNIRWPFARTGPTHLSWAGPTNLLLPSLPANKRRRKLPPAPPALGVNHIITPGTTENSGGSELALVNHQLGPSNFCLSSYGPTTGEFLH